MERVTDLERQYVLEVLDNQFRSSTNGIFNHRLEAKFAERLEVNHAVAVSSGTAALHVALAAGGIQAGDEVIVPPLTMASTSLSVLQSHGIPVYADVDRSTFTLDPQSVQACLSDRTKAVIPVALYGLAADYDGTMALCRGRKLFMIEDNAQCFLGRHRGRLAGQFGDFACYSFQASKHMTCGDGGMLTTHSEEAATRARRFSTLGYSTVSARKGKIDRKVLQDPAFNRHTGLGFNYRLSELNAAVALAQLERLEELVAVRVRAAALYRDAVREFRFLIPQGVPEGSEHVYWTYPLLLDTPRPDVDWYEFRDLFLRNGGEGYYAAWQLTYREPLMRDIKLRDHSIRQTYEPGLCPNAEYVQPRLIQLQTNLWEPGQAEKQAESLHKTANEFGG